MMIIFMMMMIMMMQLSHTYNNYHSGDDFHDNDDAHTYNATTNDNSVCMGRKTGTGKEMTLKNFNILVLF